MAHPNITLLGATYSNVPLVLLPKSGGGQARFSDATTYELVYGEFTTNSTAGTQSVSIPYLGTGYPIAVVVMAKGGILENSTYSAAVQRYAIGAWSMTKAYASTTPTYGTSGNANIGIVECTAKNSTSDATVYTRSGGNDAVTYNSGSAANSAKHAVRLNTGNVLSFYVAASATYGLLHDCNYEYFIVYKS